MLIGYARVSTQDQSLEPQVQALTAAGCERVFSDTASGGRMDRTGLKEALSHLRAGDVLVVWKLDRLGRTTRGMLEFSGDLEARQVGLRSLTDHIDTTSAAGRMFFTLMCKRPARPSSPELPASPPCDDSLHRSRTWKPAASKTPGTNTSALGVKAA